MSRTSHQVAVSPEAAGPGDRHVRQERGAPRKAAAVGGCDDVIEGAGQEHRGGATDATRPGAAQVKGGVPRRQQAGQGGFGRLLRTSLSHGRLLALRVGGGVTLRCGRAVAASLRLQVGTLGVILHVRMRLLGVTLTLSGGLHGVCCRFLDIRRG